MVSNGKLNLHQVAYINKWLKVNKKGWSYNFITPAVKTFIILKTQSNEKLSIHFFNDSLLINYKEKQYSKQIHKNDLIYFFKVLNIEKK